MQVRLMPQDSAALHLNIFDQPGKIEFFRSLLDEFMDKSLHEHGIAY
jgi:hypothetical protein